MHDLIQLKEETRWIPDDYESLSRLVGQHFFDKDLVRIYFEAYEKIKNPTIKDRFRYYFVKYYYTEKRWECLNHLGELYLMEERFSLAYMCFIESLRLNSDQPDVFQKALNLQGSTKPEFPKELKENACKVSVITCTRGRLEELQESIKSVLNQTFQDFELIIVNDGGMDEVQDVINGFMSPKIRYIKLDKNKSVPVARNEAIRIAEGKYISYLDDDDCFYPDHLENLVKALEETNYPVVYSNSLAIQGIIVDGKFVKTKKLFLWGGKFDKDLLVQQIFITVDSIMHKKELFQKVGLFNKEFSQGGDWELWLRFAEHYDFKHVNKSTIEWRHKVDNMTLTKKVSAHVLGDVICHYYAFYKGDVAFLKYYCCQGDLAKAKELYAEIKKRYDHYFKTPKNLEELIDIAFTFRDRSFQRKMIKDCFQRNPRRCLSFIMRRKSLFLFLNIVIYMPKVIFRSARVRCRKILKISKK